MQGINKSHAQRADELLARFPNDLPKAAIIFAQETGMDRVTALRLLQIRMLSNMGI